MDAAIMVMAMIIGYLLPAVIASGRKHRSANAIFMANFIFGWTVIGWALCLIWALTSNVEPKTA